MKSIKGLSINDANDDYFVLLLNGKEIIRYKWIALCRSEKKRLGFNPTKLVFIGMANFSKYYWCAMQYLMKSQTNEMMFFKAYISDRFQYSKELNRIKEIPKTIKEFLKIGDDITSDDIEKLLRKRKSPPPLTKEKEEKLRKESISANYFRKGEICQALQAERYPSIRWNFKFDKFILLGIPDGIANDYTYEFKATTKKDKAYSEKTALRQASPYSIFFQRVKVRTQVLTKEDENITTFNGDIAKEEIDLLYSKWVDLVDGKKPLPPMAWKCSICEYKDKCPIKPKIASS